MKIKAKLIFLITLSVFVFAVSADAFAKRKSRRDLIPDPKKYAAVVVHSDTGLVLHEKNADRKRHPASLVKMMTLYMTFKALEERKLSLNQYLSASRKAARQPSLNIGMKRGEKIKVRDAVYALIVRSANDVAVVLAEAIAGNEKDFAKMMNKQARLIGLKNTTFRNASGLYHREQKTTARDMANLLIALQRDFPRYYRYMSRTNFMKKGRQYKSHNKLLTNYKGTTGGKTGYINASGFNLATSANRRGHNVVAVVMGGKTSKSRDRIMISLLDKGFSMVKGVSSRKIANVANIPAPKLRPWRKPVTVAAVNKIDNKSLWSIELGGFSQEYEVINAVTNAMDVAPDQLAYSQINFVNKKVGGEQSHWARFLSLTERQAKLACQALLSSETNCNVIEK